MQPRSRFDFFRLAAWIAAVCIALAIPAYAQKGKGGGPASQTNFEVQVLNDETGTAYQASTYLPTCSALTPGNNNYSAVFSRHDLCATVTTSTGYQLTDDIVIEVITTKGLITSVQLHGQDVIGEEGIAHESEVIPLLPPATPSAAGFTLHIHADNVPIWKLSRHLGGKRVKIVGYISLGDMIYTPQQ